MAQISLNNAINNVSYYNMAFAVLVAEIGEKAAFDISEDGLQSTIQQLMALDIEHGVIVDEVDLSKKKLI